jgi:hypothetical protein
MRRPHVQIHLPPLDAHEALALVDLLERAIAAVWRTHGEDMAEIRAAGSTETSRLPNVVALPGLPSEDDCF